jgi:hypothetical protein
MERYIDAYKLIDILRDREVKAAGVYGDLGGAVMGCIRLVEIQPTADVAPKSEVEHLRHKYDLAVAEREANVKGFTEELSKAKAEVAREIFEEIEDLFFKNGVFIHIPSYNELKKKYTEPDAE